MLDLIYDIDSELIRSPGKARTRTVFTQPGLRYAQAEALITSLMQDDTFRDLGIRERMRISKRILGEIRGRYVIYHGDDNMLDDIGIQYLNAEKYLLGLG